MQTLQSLARAVAVFTDSIQPAHAAGQAAGAAPGEGPAPDLQRISGAVTFINLLAMALANIGAEIAIAAQAPAAPAASKEQRRLAVTQRVFVGELVGALVDSRLLEHFARLVLVAVAAQAQAQADDLVLRLLCLFKAARSSAWRMMLEVEDAPACGGPAAAAKLRALLGGPCGLYLTLTAGLAALRLADGGPSHGLPGEVLQAMPVSGAAIGPVDARHLHGRQGICAATLQSLLDCLGDLSQPKPHPRASPGSAAAASILLRIGRWALESARAWAEAEQAPAPDGAGVSVPLPLRPLIPASFLIGAFNQSQSSLETLLRTERARAPPRSWAGHACAERWRLLVEACGCALPHESFEGDVPALAELWAPAAAEQAGQDGMLPTAPPAPLHAALAAGLLPCLERLLRRAGQAPEGREADLVVALLQPRRRCDSLLARLLAYGDPAQAAALVATLAKLLMRRSDQSSSKRVSETACAATSLLHASCPRFLGPEPSAGHPQLQRMLLRSAVEWLPPLSASLQATAALASENERAGWVRESKREWMDAVRSSAGPVLLWILILLGDQQRAAAGFLAAPAAASDGGGVSGADGSVNGGGSGSSGGGDGDGGWTRILVEEVGALPLLGSLLRCMELWDPVVETAENAAASAAFAHRIVHACCLLALAAPQELRRATEQGAAAEAAAGSGQAAEVHQTGGTGSGGGGGGEPGAMPLPLSYWRPKALTALAEKLGRAGYNKGVLLTSRLVGLLSTWARGDGCAVRFLLEAAVVKEGPSAEQDTWARRWRPLPPLAETRGSLLPACAHPRCVSLDGDSEAGRELRRYPGCGEVEYCSEACATEHGGGAAGVAGEAAAEGSRAS